MKTCIKWKIRLQALVIICLLLTNLPCLAVSSGWSIEPLVEGNDIRFITPGSFFLDSQGSTHSVWGGSRLYYSVRSDAGTSLEVVDYFPGSGDSACLTVNDDGVPFIFHHVWSNQELKISWKENGQWNYHSFGSVAIGPYSSDIACDSAGNPHGVFSKTDSDDVVHIWRHSNGQWNLEIIDSCTSGLDCRIKVHDDIPRVIYHDDNTGDLVYAVRSGSGWDRYSLETPACHDGLYNAFDVDRWGHAYICFFDTTNDQVKHVIFDGTSFGTVYTVDTVQSSTRMDLELGSDDRVYVIYNSIGEESCKIAYGLTSGWDYHIVDSGGQTGLGVSIQIDDNDMLYCRYYNNDEHVMFGTKGDFGSGGWITWDIFHREFCGVTPLMKRDSEGNPHVISFHFPHFSPHHILHNGERWQIDPYPLPETLGIDFDYAFFSDNRILAISADSHDLLGHYFDGAAWHSAIIWSFSEAVMEINMEISSDNNIHVFCYTPADTKAYYLSSSTWNGSYTSENVGECAGGCDLTLDSTDMPHVVYFDNNIHLLRHAWRTGTGSWNSEDIAPDNYSNVQMVMTSDNSLYIARQSSMGSAINFVYRGTHAYIETDFTDDEFLQPGFDLALNGDGQPALVYKQGTHKELRYAVYDGIDWSAESPRPGLEVSNQAMIYSPQTGMTISTTEDYTKDHCMITNRTGVFYDLRLNNTLLQPMEPFLLNRYCGNSMDDSFDIDEYVILDVMGMFWFYPSWSETLDYDSYYLYAGYSTTESILNFVWPRDAGSFSGIVFWGGLVTSDTTELLAYDFVQWGYEE